MFNNPFKLISFFQQAPKPVEADDRLNPGAQFGPVKGFCNKIIGAGRDSLAGERRGRPGR